MSAPSYPPPLPPPPATGATTLGATTPGAGRERRDTVLLAAALALLGLPLGLAWSAWSPVGPAAADLGHGVFEVFAETESFVAGDGRFLVIVSVVAVLAALLAWFRLPLARGPFLVGGLAVGALLGALATELIGHLSGGGSFGTRAEPLSDGTTAQVTFRLPLSLHMQGLLFVEPALVVLVYGLLVAFAVRDDLGRPDSGRTDFGRTDFGRTDPATNRAGGSIDAGGDPQHGGGDGDAAGVLQQRDLPAQQPRDVP